MEWTKGHSDNDMNNEVDELCVFAARCLNLPKDELFDQSKESGESLVSVSEAQRSYGTNDRTENGEIVYSLR